MAAECSGDWKNNTQRSGIYTKIKRKIHYKCDQCCSFQCRNVLECMTTDVERLTAVKGPPKSHAERLLLLWRYKPHTFVHETSPLVLNGTDTHLPRITMSIIFQ